MLDLMNIPIEEFIDQTDYLASTQKSYSYALHRFGDWIDKDHPGTEITAALIKQFLNEHSWSDNMKRLYGNAIKAFIRWRCGDEHPALLVKLPKDNARPGRSLEMTDLDLLMAHFDTTQPAAWRNLSMISLMVETGIRESEVCRVEMRDVDLHKRRFAVLAKGNTWRAGIFTEVTARFLDVWLTARKKIVLPGVPFVFVSIKGKRPGGPMHPAGLRALFRAFGLRAGIGKLSPHDLRRTMALLLIENGAPTRLVQELGGWNDVRMVERYTRNLKPCQIDRYSPLLDEVQRRSGD